MNHIDADKVHIVDEPLDAINVIRERSLRGQVYDESFYICNISDIVKKHRIWKQYMPRVIPYYAVKCNDSPIVIETLALMGVGFDCASRGEISNVMNYDVDAKSIIYASPTKPIAHLKYAAAMNVNVMTVDSDSELQKIRAHYPKANLLLRIRCDAKVSLSPLGDKYGCCPDTEAEHLIELAKSMDLNIVGISFHVGSGCQDPPAYSKAIHASRKLFDFAENLGFHFNILDIGGGFPGDNNTNIELIATIINDSLDLHFASSNVTFIAEPGRFYVASAYTLACQVHSIREIRQNGQLDSMMYYVNDGVYGSFNCNLTDHKAIYPLTLKGDNEKMFRSTIWGPTCDALDRVCENISMPRLDIDDFIIFENMGAYTLPMATNFNGFALPNVEYFIERKHLRSLFPKGTKSI
ncbi:ornithine decarboxylase 1-like isoform X2 [Bradysia coprophila]|uniref:ornithine decarboxylase 1-like isoform X2 n=1 Tax=Bradysia coprophila TaxID=38358 RepID=UPI00187D7880|nr:ornithine decarboxylase 1-like isoform X2 [Bradysia coprophila]XP_037049960.1 ornithine decarboxylase 1-like isoform X2 [Bradysia coprophila]